MSLNPHDAIQLSHGLAITVDGKRISLGSICASKQEAIEYFRRQADPIFSRPGYFEQAEALMAEYIAKVAGAR